MPQVARLWRCPRCGRTRPGATADARNPVCRYDLAEMQIYRSERPDNQGPMPMRNGNRNGPIAKPPLFKKRRRRK